MAESWLSHGSRIAIWLRQNRFLHFAIHVKPHQNISPCPPSAPPRVRAGGLPGDQLPSVSLFRRRRRACDGSAASMALSWLAIALRSAGQFALG